VRGGPLSSADVVDVLRPFVVACWSGRGTDVMPEEVRALWKEAKPGGRNISCMVLDSSGALVKAWWPLPDPAERGGGDPFGRERLGRLMKEQIEKASADLEKPAPPEKKLTLPTAEKEGVRILLALKVSGRAPMNYKAPTVEAVTATAAEKKALEYPESAREVAAADLRRWLEQIYPAAIMDSSGKPPALKGTLTLSPAGKRAAILKGELVFTMDDRAATEYRGTLEVAITYGEGRDYVSLRGLFEGIYPKSDPKRGKPMEHSMTAVIESTPE
jgi:hypothetical protein